MNKEIFQDNWWQNLPDNERFDYIIVMLNNESLEIDSHDCIEENKEFLERIVREKGFEDIEKLLTHYKAKDLLRNEDYGKPLLNVEITCALNEVYSQMSKGSPNIIMTAPEFKKQISKNEVL